MFRKSTPDSSMYICDSDVVALESHTQSHTHTHKRPKVTRSHLSIGANRSGFGCHSRICCVWNTHSHSTPMLPYENRIWICMHQHNKHKSCNTNVYVFVRCTKTNFVLFVFVRTLVPQMGYWEWTTNMNKLTQNVKQDDKRELRVTNEW